MTGDEFKIKREKLGYSQQELGDLLSVTRVTISRWENSNKIPKSQENAINQLYHNDTSGVLLANEGDTDIIIREKSKENHNELKAHYGKLLKKINKLIERLEKEDGDLNTFKELTELIQVKKNILNDLESL